MMVKLVIHHGISNHYLVHTFSVANESIDNMLVGSVEFMDGGYNLQYFPDESIATLWPSMGL